MGSRREGEEIDRALHAKNRAAWNAWACQDLSDETRAVLVAAKAEIPEDGAWAAMEGEVRAALAERAPSLAYEDLPDFRQDAYLDFATFTRGANFSSATFTQAAYFDSATFTQAAYFDSATFTQTAYFGSAMFTQAANFESATFEGRAYFTASRFGDEDKPQPALLNLTDTEIVKPASFRDAAFLERYPDFTGSTVNDKTLFPSEGENWPSATDQDVNDGRASCAFLRHHLNKQGLPEAELFFFKREMEFAGQIGGFWQRLPYRFYGWSSDYGSSILKPCHGLLAIWLVPALI